MSQHSETIDHIISQLGDLPALPTVVTQVLRLTEDPTSATTDVSNAIQDDPALTAKVLRVSNSSYYGMKQYVGTLKLALVILGVREVRNIVLGISVFETLNNGKHDLQTAKEIWHNSLKVAGMARKLATNMGLGLQGEEFIAGLLSDIGKMGLLRILGDKYAHLLDALGENPALLCSAEDKALGYTNADVAKALSVLWNLPQTLADGLWHQYPCQGRSLGTAKDPMLAAVVRISKLACQRTATGEVPQAALDDFEAWDILSRAKNPIPHDQRLVVLGDYLDSLSNAPAIAL
ncbi:MAG: HDOD domain-containing protein [Candidatus Hydrogenedentes bacterium]|nr:HDOD domain-containing protein [Candidatus Hydrogenedentota bacterium]